MATTDGSPTRNQSDVFDSTSNGKARHTGLRIALVILGVVRIVLAASTSDLSRGLKILSIVLGILTIIAGVICFTRPQASLVILAILLAAGWIADGIGDLAR